MLSRSAVGKEVCMAAQDQECAEGFRWARTVRFVFEFRAAGDEEDVCVESALQGLICFAAEATLNRCLDTVAERNRCKLYCVVSSEYALTPREEISPPPCEEAVPCPTLAELIAEANCIPTREPEQTRCLGLITRVSTR